MDIAALIAWLVTAGGGFALLGIWIGSGGLRQQESGASRFPAGLIFGHLLLAAVGLLVWIGFVISDETTGLAWAAAALLVPVALLGFAMLLRWWRGRQALAVAADEPSGTVPAEQRFPLPLVALHGLVAVTTVVLVVLAAVAAS